MEIPLLLFINTANFTIGLVAMLLSLFVLLLLSALVSGSEVAFFSLSPQLTQKLEEESTAQSKSILAMVQKPRELLATILISNNFINVAIILLSSLISRQVFDLQSFAIMGFTISETVLNFSLNVIVITFLILMLGEVIPKVYAAKYPVNLLRVTVGPLNGINQFLVATKVTPLLIKSTVVFDNVSTIKSQSVTVDDLKHALDLTSSETDTDEERKILEGVVKFGNTDVKQIMTPRVNAVLVDVETSFDSLIRLIKETRYSRIPVFSESIDKVVGVIYAKDLLPFLDVASVDWQSLIREPFFVPENKKIDDLLTEFQSKKTHLAMVVDEYGGISGLVTLEDVIEEIVGDISDEFDDEDVYYSKINEHTFVFDGTTSLINMYRALRVKGDEFEHEKGEADSIAGFVLEVAGRIPLKGESITFKNYCFTIESADRRRIKSVKIEVNEK